MGERERGGERVRERERERERTHAPLSEVFSAGDSSITHRKRPLILVDNIKSPRRQLTSLLVVKWE